MALPPPGNDRAAIVTGASSGIGEQFAQVLARRGYQVVLVARSADRLEELAAQLRPQAHPLPADLSDRTARAGLLDRIATLDLVPDILINNAGFSTLGLVAKSVPEQEVNLVEVDVAAVVDLCSRFLPGMVDRHRGAVLNVASMAGFGPLPGQAAYGAAKAFVLAYTHSLRGELRGTGVSATALCPGPVDTGFGEAAGFSKEDAESALPRVMWGSRGEGGAGRNRRSGSREGCRRPRSCQPGRVGLFPRCATRVAFAGAVTQSSGHETQIRLTRFCRAPTETCRRS